MKYFPKPAHPDDEMIDELTSGIFVGEWKKEIVPHLERVFLSNQLVFDKKATARQASCFPSLVAAVTRCAKQGDEPVYRGPAELQGLEIGDNVAVYLGDMDGDSSVHYEARQATKCF